MHQGAPEINDEPAQKDGKGQVLERGNPGHPEAAVPLSGTVILTYEGGAGLAEGIHKDISQDFQVERCRRRCHNIGAQAVDGGLDNNIRQRKDGALHACRHADAEDFRQQGPVNFHEARTDAHYHFRVGQKAQEKAR
jgi:hypothetical protein